LSTVLKLYNAGGKDFEFLSVAPGSEKDKKVTRI